MSEREIRLREMLSGAIDLAPEQRRAYVLSASNDSALCQEVLDLIEDMAALDDFLEEPAVGLIGSRGETVVDRPLESSLAPKPALAPPEQVGPYRLEARLGGGGMGVVYRAFDARLERPVALKQIKHGHGNEESQRRFHREARAVARLDHPSIVRVHDWLQTEDGDWLVLELVEGRHLRDVLDAEGPLPAARVVSIGSDIAGALTAAHEAGILHRDLKPENVMLTSQGEVKLLDFGLVKHLATADSATGASWMETLTAKGRILGTVSAMSPEQAMGGELDERSDLFSLGALLYRLLTGHAPFDGGAPVATMRAIVFEPHRPIPEGIEPPPALVRLIDQLLSKERDKRPDSARQVHIQLREIATGLQAAAVAASEVPTAQRSQRRPVTVIAAGLAPELRGRSAEELLDIVPRLDQVIVDVIERWDGRLEGRMGDRWIACFGVPQAREDDARRAVHAGLDLLSQAATACEQCTTPLTVGVHSGLAVMTRIAGREELALGATFDTVTTMQERSREQVMVSAETRRRVGRFFRLEKVGDDYQVIGVEDESEAHTGGRVPLWGRATELERLHEAFSSARQGRGRVVLVSGEAGIGKTRLLGQLRSNAREQDQGPVRWLELYGSSVRRAAPFQPVIHHLRRTLDLPAESTPASQLLALESWVEGLDLPLEEMVPYLVALLGVTESRYDSADLDPRLRKRRIQETLATLWLEAAERQPIIFIVEDLQWLDPSTLDLLSLLIEQVPTVSMLLVLTHRLEYQPPWSARGYVSEIRLERLDRDAAEHLVSSVAGAQMPSELVERIAQKADGIPLYVEELTRVVLGSGHLREEEGRLELVKPLEHLVIPATLEESLAARLDRLGEEAMAVAQVASVIGREFSHQLLAAVGDLESASLETGLERLVEADMAYRKGFGRRTRYLFRHALVQDAAYASLLRKERRELHRRVAAALQAGQAPAPDVLAHHLSAAGAWQEAIVQWQAASTAALLTSAHREAESHVRRAMTGLGKLKLGRPRELAELSLLTQLGRALAGLRGYSADEVLEAYERAAELCESLHDEAAVVEVTWGLWAFYIVRSDIPQAMGHARRLLRAAEQSGATADWMVAHSSMAVAAYFGGDLQAAERHAEAAIDHEAANPDRELSTASPQDLGVNALVSLALVAWHLGRGAEAVTWADRALDLARSFKHPYSYVFAASWAARLGQSRRDPQATLKLAAEVIKTSEQHGFFWITQGWYFRGCALVQEAHDAGQPIPEEAMDLMRRGLDAYRATGAGLSVSYMLAQLTEAHLWRGELEIAVTSLAEAKAASVGQRESYWLAELERLEAEIALVKGDQDRAERSFLLAIETARNTGDVALRLRSTFGLARLWRQQGRLEEARKILDDALAPIEEDGERDVLEARLLLASMQ